MQLILEDAVAGVSHAIIPPGLIEHAEPGPLVFRAVGTPHSEPVIAEAWGRHSSLKGLPLRNLVGLELATAMSAWAHGEITAQRVRGRSFAAHDGPTTHRLRLDLAKSTGDPLTWLVLVEILPSSADSDERIAQLTSALASAEARLRVLESSRAVAARFSAQIADLSHELRTPLNGVLAVADMLTQRPLSDHDLELATLIRDSGAAMLALLNRTLRDAQGVGDAAAGGLSGASADVVHETFALQPLLDSLSRTWAIAAQRKSLAFHSPGSDFAGAVVSGDSVRLNQILTNLLSNAVKFTSQGQIAFRVERENSGAEALYRFIVEDTGPGFSPEIRAKLFSRGATQADEIDAGAGLGLNLSRRFAEAMGGRIQAQASQTGGARMVVELTMTEIAAPAATRIRESVGWAWFLGWRR